MSKPSALAVQHLPDVLDAYVNKGQSLQEKANEIGVSRRTLYNWLLTDLGKDKYQEVVTQALVNRIADADQSLHDAADSLHVARAREEARYSRMDFERRRPHLYGQKQELTVAVAPILNISVVPQPQIAVQHEETERVVVGTDEIVK